MRESKSNKKEVTLRNVMFPIWFLILFPITWVAVLPANFIIDSIVLLISAKLLKLANIKETYKKSILKVWIIGFASDFIGAGVLFLGSERTPKWREYLYSISWNPFDNWYAVLYVAFAIIVSAVFIYILNYRLSFWNLDISKKQKRILALSLAVFTAPYVLLYPSALINGNSWDQLHFMTNHIVKMDEYHLEVSVNHDSSGKTYNMSSLQTDTKDAVNQAEKITGKNTIKFEQDYTLNFYNRDYTVKREIPIMINGEKGYFQYRNEMYLIDQEKLRPFLKAMTDAEETQGKLEFVITPDPKNFISNDLQPEQIDKEGNKLSDYPIFEDSRYKYYISENNPLEKAMIKFEGKEEMDIYTAIESGLVTPQELIGHGMKITVEPRE